MAPSLLTAVASTVISLPSLALGSGPVGDGLGDAGSAGLKGFPENAPPPRYQATCPLTGFSDAL